jgi:hypothetical protein
MNQRYNEISGDQVTAESVNERHDLRQRDIVEHGISVQQSSNTMSAVEYLRSCDVCPEVIERVLLDPARRRAALG